MGTRDRSRAGRGWKSAEKTERVRGRELGQAGVKSSGGDAGDRAGVLRCSTFSRLADLELDWVEKRMAF